MRKGLERIKNKNKDIEEWEAGKPHEGPVALSIGNVEKSSKEMMDIMIAKASLGSAKMEGGKLVARGGHPDAEGKQLGKIGDVQFGKRHPDPGQLATAKLYNQANKEQIKTLLDTHAIPHDMSVPDYEKTKYPEKKNKVKSPLTIARKMSIPRGSKVATSGGSSTSGDVLTSAPAAKIPKKNFLSGLKPLEKYAVEKAYLGSLEPKKTKEGKTQMEFTGSGVMPKGTPAGSSFEKPGPIHGEKTMTKIEGSGYLSPPRKQVTGTSPKTPYTPPKSTTITTSGGVETSGDVITSAKPTPPKPPGSSGSLKPGHEFTLESIKRAIDKSTDKLMEKASDERNKKYTGKQKFSSRYHTQAFPETIRDMLAVTDKHKNKDKDPLKKQKYSVTKSAIDILKASEEEMSPANPKNEPGPVTGFNMGGKDRAATSCKDDTGEEHHAGKGPAQESVSGFPQAGKGPAKTSVNSLAHGGMGPAQTSVTGKANSANLSKALTSRAMPRMPRAVAMAMDTWRSATRVLNASNLEKHAGTGPLTGELIEQVEVNSLKRAPEQTHILKSCYGCGRTYTFQKGIREDCPTCSMNKSQHCPNCHEYLLKGMGGHRFCPNCG